VVDATTSPYCPLSRASPLTVLVPLPCPYGRGGGFSFFDHWIDDFCAAGLMPSCNCWECEAAAAAGYHAASDKSYCEERFPFAPQASVPGHRSDSSVQYAPQSVQCCTHFFVSMLTGGQHEFALSLCTLSPLLPTNQGILRGTRRRPSSALFHLPRSPTMRQVTMRAMRL